ncbi:indolepyruvate oxidoreductase subunit beta [Paradesulfitobacterium ferrireducens]|uniref:indolepyruvate oxidoreductase subunit beta n=1 Tax=Paradesulfitobacterium ferrireducens TaxID=2816476 RepID=UPI001A8F74F4|nr:indolepyruvate oxidoreductase subunit beta [Paradesulfitobacterium ferrireducens]
MKNCILVGVGGQGTILASKLIAQAAMDKGKQALTTETIGMAQRGGSVVSHIRIGSEIYSPLIPLQAADLVIGFEPAEAVRALPYLKKDSMVIVSKRAIIPVTSAFSGSNYNGMEMMSYLKDHVENLIVVDTDTICRLCGSNKVVNLSLLGVAAAGGVLDISLNDLENTIRKVLPEHYIEMNIKALHLGAKSITEQTWATH